MKNVLQLSKVRAFVTPFRSVLSPLPSSTVLAQPRGHPHAEHSPALEPPGPRSLRGGEISHAKVKHVLTWTCFIPTVTALLERGSK